MEVWWVEFLSGGIVDDPSRGGQFSGSGRLMGKVRRILFLIKTTICVVFELI